MSKQLTFKIDVKREGKTLNFNPNSYATKFSSYLNEINHGGFYPFHYLGYKTSKFLVDRSDVREDKGDLAILIEGVENLGNRRYGLSGYETGIIFYDNNYISDEEIMEISGLGMLNKDNLTVRSVEKVGSFRETLRNTFLVATG